MAVYDVVNWYKGYKKNKLTKKRVYELLLSKGFHGTTVYRIEQVKDTIEMEIGLPPHKEMINVKTSLLRNLQQEFMASDSGISVANGKFITMRFGMKKLYPEMLWNPTMLSPDSCKVLFHSSYGDYYVDFEDDVSAHGCIGGTSGFGKSVAMQHIMTTLYVQNKGEIDFHISSVKLEDYYPFFDCKNVYTSENNAEMLVLLKNLKNEYEKRKRKLRSKSLLHAKDSKTVKERYPEQYKDFKPIFVFIDEFARFSNDSNIVKLVDELVAVTRYLNIHFILGTQRPSANDVFTPTIRQNLSFRLGLYCENRANSEMVIGKQQFSCDMLPKIKGRGILVDKETMVVHIPFMETEYCYELLKPFRKCEDNENVNRTRSTDNQLPEKVQSNVEGSTGDSGMSESCINERTDEIPGSGNEQNSTTFNPEWLD